MVASGARSLHRRDQHHVLDDITRVLFKIFSTQNKSHVNLTSIFSNTTPPHPPNMSIPITMNMLMTSMMACSPFFARCFHHRDEYHRLRGLHDQLCHSTAGVIFVLCLFCPRRAGSVHFAGGEGKKRVIRMLSMFEFHNFCLKVRW